jgi:hypothetical protein
MYQLTAAEAATVLAVLSRRAGAPSSEVDAPGIAPSTFYAVRRKIYDAGWVVDRYVPQPWALGVTAVDCVLIRPRPSERPRLEAAWASAPENVVLWSGSNILFGLSFRHNGQAPQGVDGHFVSVTAEKGSIPVYFDYSRPWSRFVRVERETGYPRPLGQAKTPAPPSPSAALAELLDQDHEGGAGPLKGHAWHSPSKLPRNLARLTERGLVESRTLLNLDALPPYDDRTLGEIVFLAGELRHGTSPTDVLGALNNECRVSPLFMAEDGTKVTMIALGQLDATASGRTRVPRAAQNVAETLESVLEVTQLTIERTDGLRRLVDHRYGHAMRIGTNLRTPDPAQT